MAYRVLRAAFVALVKEVYYAVKNERKRGSYSFTLCRLLSFKLTDFGPVGQIFAFQDAYAPISIHLR